MTELAGFVAACLHKNEIQSLQQQHALWTQLESFSRQVHASLDPVAVAQFTAHEGRRLLACDQLAVVGRRGPDAEVLAISGAGAVEPHSRLVRALQALGDSVFTWGEAVVYDGQRDAALPTAVAQALDAYLVECNARVVIALPLADGPTLRRHVLIAESHNPATSAEQLRERLERLAGHAGPALANADHVSQIPLQKLLTRLRDWTTGRSLARLGLVAAIMAAAIAGLTLVPASLRLEARGQLLPTQRQFVYAPFAGKIVEVKARPGDRVDKGQELLYVEDLDTQLQVDQLALKIASAEVRLALLSDQLGKSTNNEERNTLTRERVQHDYEMRKAMAERDILLHGSRSPRKAPVLAPLAGKVVTFDVQEQLLGKVVRPGDSLLRVAAVKGTWEIELQIPERHVGPIREGLQASADGFVDVDLLLTNEPRRTYKGRLHREGLGGETTIQDNRVVLPARVRLHDSDLERQMENLPVGLEARAKVHCGVRPVGQVWFFEFWEFLYEHVLF